MANLLTALTHILPALLALKNRISSPSSPPAYTDHLVHSHPLVRMEPLSLPREWPSSGKLSKFWESFAWYSTSLYSFVHDCVVLMHKSYSPLIVHLNWQTRRMAFFFLQSWRGQEVRCWQGWDALAVCSEVAMLTLRIFVYGLPKFNTVILHLCKCFTNTVPGKMNSGSEKIVISGVVWIIIIVVGVPSKENILVLSVNQGTQTLQLTLEPYIYFTASS